MFVYDAEFVDNSFYENDNFQVYEYTSEREFKVKWKPISEFLDGKTTLYPIGLLDLVIEELMKDHLVIRTKQETTSPLSLLEG